MIAAAVGVVRLAEKGRPHRRALAREAESKLAELVRDSVLEWEEVVEAPAVVDAVEEILLRLDGVLDIMLDGEGDYPQPEVVVIDSLLVNAVAFPGNLIVVYSGLIDAVESAEELAGVLAHEMAHVAYRDATKALIREVGLSVILSMVGGGQLETLAGEVVRGAVRITYGRRAESRADAFALELLVEAEIDPSHFTKMLRQLEEASEDLPEWVAYIDTHPAMGDRISRAEEFAGAAAGRIWRPLEIDWENVRDSLPSPFDAG
jgi:predicted Zn-dependent protease